MYVVQLLILNNRFHNLGGGTKDEGPGKFSI